MMKQDADGCFIYCGRGDDMLKVSGKWLSPSEVEDCLLKHGAVSEVAVVAVTDAAGLTKPCAYVVLKNGDASASAEQLQTHVKESLEPYKYPRVVHFVSDLPRTHLGKINRGKLREMAMETSAS